MCNNPKVIITDGGYKHTLALVRHLGKNGVKCCVLSNNNAQSFYSKYCSERHLMPNSITNENLYVKKLFKLAKENKYDAILPISLHANDIITKNKEKLQKYTNVPTVDYETFELAARKDKIFQYAEKIGLNIPKTTYPENKSELDEIKNFPVIIKPAKKGGKATMVRNKKELESKFKQISNQSLYDLNPIIQEYIPGKGGNGFYALYNEGNIVEYYIHDRIRMFPPEGGPSTTARTYYDKNIYRYGKKILDSLKWHGVAMVEFKKSSKDGKYYLIEINPKYWGSLDLGLESGVKIPYKHVMVALDRKKFEKNDYKKNLYFQWPIEDFRHGLSKKNIFKGLLEWFLITINPEIKSNIMLEDIKPTLWKMPRYLIGSLVRKATGNLN